MFTGFLRLRKARIEKFFFPARGRRERSIDARRRRIQIEGGSVRRAMLLTRGIAPPWSKKKLAIAVGHSHELERAVLALLVEPLRLRLISSHLLTQSPSSRLQQILLVHLANVQALHRVAQFLRRLQHYFRILVMRRSLYDGAGAHCRIARFEDTRADEPGLCAHLHDEGGVCGWGDATRRKIRHWQLAVFRDPSYQLERRAEFFRFVHQFFFAEQSEPLHLTDNGAHVSHRFNDVPRACLAL